MPPGSMRPTCRACSSTQSPSNTLPLPLPSFAGVLTLWSAKTLGAFPGRAPFGHKRRSQSPSVRGTCILVHKQFAQCVPISKPLSNVQRCLKRAPTRSGRPLSSTTRSGMAPPLPLNMGTPSNCGHYFSGRPLAPRRAQGRENKGPRYRTRARVPLRPRSAAVCFPTRAQAHSFVVATSTRTLALSQAREHRADAKRHFEIRYDIHISRMF